jgi:ribosomal protein S18 acetylase RimI-like enzyme
MMKGITIRLAEAADAAQLNAALRELSKDMGDTHLASDEDVLAAGFGKTPSFLALLAECENEVVGVAMFSSFYSTTRGTSGVFVSDLWVAKPRRGAGLARNLLASVCEVAADKWQCSCLRLNVYKDNHGAIAAYEKLGFDTDHNENVMTLNAIQFNTLMGANSEGHLR